MRVVLTAVAIVAFASTPVFSQCPEADQKKLEQFDRAWGDAGERGDRALLQGVYADDYAGLSTAGFTGKTQAIDMAVRDSERARTGARPAPKVVHDYYMISCTPATATITHRNVITKMIDGKENSTYSRSVHFLEKRGDRWQVVSNAGNPLGDGAIVLYMEHEWNAADLKRDYAWHERNYSDDFSGISSRTGALSNKSEDIAFSKKGTLATAKLSELDVRVEGNTAIVTGVNQLTGTDDKGAAFDRKVRFTDTFVKRDGRWLVWASQGTAIS